MCPPFLRKGPARDGEAEARKELAREEAVAHLRGGQLAQGGLASQAVWNVPLNTGISNYYTTNTAGVPATSYTASSLRKS